MAVVVAIALSNQSALRAFRESVDAVAGRANYQIASDSGLDEDLLLKLQPFWPRGVRFAPVIDVEGMIEPEQLPIRTPGSRPPQRPPLPRLPLRRSPEQRRYGRCRVLSRSLHDDSIVLPATFAREHDLRLGRLLDTQHPRHETTMIVRGLLEARGPATAFNGAIGIADIATAQNELRYGGPL